MQNNSLERFLCADSEARFLRPTELKDVKTVTLEPNVNVNPKISTGATLSILLVFKADARQLEAL